MKSKIISIIWKNMEEYIFIWDDEWYKDIISKSRQVLEVLDIEHSKERYDNLDSLWQEWIIKELMQVMEDNALFIQRPN